MSGAATREAIALGRELALLCGADAVITDPNDLAASARDGWPRLRFAEMVGETRYAPEVIVFPADAAQVQAVIAFANARRIPLVTTGGHQGGNGAALAVRGGIELSTRRLAGLVHIDALKRFVHVQCGTKLLALEEELRACGMTLGAMPAGASGSTVGGFLATRSGGPSSAQLGKAEDLLLAFEAVDGTGTFLQALEGPRRGVDLGQILLGSEGTLAVFTSARLRISPLPRAQVRLGLRCGSMVDGMRAMQAVLRGGFRPSLTRLLDPLAALFVGAHSPAQTSKTADQPLPAPLRALLTGGQQEIFRAALRAPRILNGLAEAFGGSARLLFQFDGYGERASEDANDDRAAVLRACQEACACEPIENRAIVDSLRPREKEDYANLFAAGAFVEELDVAASWEKVPAVLGALRRAASPHALLLTRIGCAYLEGAAIEATLIGPAGPISQAVQRAKSSEAKSSRAGPEHFHDALAVAEQRSDQALSSALSVALDAGASLSHASGIGLSRQLLLPREHGEGMRQLRALKRAFDPNGILNPGKLLL